MLVNLPSVLSFSTVFLYIWSPVFKILSASSSFWSCLTKLNTKYTKQLQVHWFPLLPVENLMSYWSNVPNFKNIALNGLQCSDKSFLEISFEASYWDCLLWESTIGARIWLLARLELLLSSCVVLDIECKEIPAELSRLFSTEFTRTVLAFVSSKFPGMFSDKVSDNVSSILRSLVLWLMRPVSSVMSSVRSLVLWLTRPGSSVKSMSVLLSLKLPGFPVWSVCLYLPLKAFPFLALLFFQFFDRGIMIWKYTIYNLKQGQRKAWRIPSPKNLIWWPWILTYDLENQ